MLLNRGRPGTEDEDKWKEINTEAASLLLSPRAVMYSDYEKTIRKENKDYLHKMKNILTAPRKGGIKCSDGPGELLDYLFISNFREARNPRVLKRYKITHVLNCAGKHESSAQEIVNPYDPDETGVTHYLEFAARDNDGYPILGHFQKAKRFINHARDNGGRALVHCELGVNRSGAICIAYMMKELELTLFQVLRRMKIERPVVLVNEGFQKQLIEFGREHDLLHKKSNIV